MGKRDEWIAKYAEDLKNKCVRLLSSTRSKPLSGSSTIVEP